jgi:hypothetical protein
LGLGLTILTYGLGQASPDSTTKEQLQDFALGALKGGVLKGVFRAAGGERMQGIKYAPVKGVMMGVASRDADILFNRDSLNNPSQMAAKLKQETLNPHAWALDAAVWTLGEGAFRGIDKYSDLTSKGGRTLSNMVMGSTFGMVSGGTGEIVREQTAGQKISWGKVAEQSLLGGAINGIAAGAGAKLSDGVSHLLEQREPTPPSAGNPDPTVVEETAKRKAESDQRTLNNFQAGLKDQGLDLKNFRLEVSPNNRAAKGSVLSFKIPKFTPQPLVRVESTDVPPLEEYKSPPPKEFKIVADKRQLNSFRHFDSDGITLGVKEVTGRKWLGLLKEYGPQKSLFVQRLGGNEGTLLPGAKNADLVVSCHPENLSAEDKAKHVFPEAHGKVWMVTGDEDTRLLLSAGENPISQWRKAGYRYPVRLDGGYTTINVMAPLVVGDANDVNGEKSKPAWDELDGMLKQLKEIGVDAVSTDVWWGLIEPSKRKYNWTYYDKLSDHIITSGLKWVPIMSFHQCGGNVGDTVNVPLPEWVWSDLAAKTGRPVEDFKFKSEQGHFSNEYISYWADDAAMEHYEAGMREFQNHFGAKAKNIGEINISLGPAGELRYPSYNSHDQNVGYPSRGALQAHGELAIESLRDFALTKYKGIDGVRTAWNIPNLQESEILPPGNADQFFGRNDHWNTQYGRDFFDWYNQSLIDHGNRMLSTGLKVFGTQGSAFYGIDIGAKIPGVHWRVGHWDNGRIVNGDRLAELNAGLVRTSLSDLWDEGRGNGYRPTLSFLHQLLPNRPGQGNLIVPSMTCLEMPDGQDGPDAQAMPHTLARWVGMEASRQGLWLKGENALAGNLGDPNDWDRMKDLLDLPYQNGYYHGLTFLRMGDIINNAVARAKIAEMLHAVRSVEYHSRKAA